MSNIKVPEKITRGKIGEERDRAVATYESGTQAFLLIEKILSKGLQAALLESESKDNYTDKDWSLFQADNIGYRRALREVLALLPNKEGK